MTFENRQYILVSSYKFNSNKPLEKSSPFHFHFNAGQKTFEQDELPYIEYSLLFGNKHSHFRASVTVSCLARRRKTKTREMLLIGHILHSLEDDPHLG